MYILDTNAVHYLIDPAWTSPGQLAKLQEKAHAGRLDVALPPITVMELATRVANEPTWFGRIRASAAAVLELCPTPLPDPEQRMREIIDDVDLPRQSYDHWKLILETIACAPDHEALQNGFDDYKTASRRSANVIHLAAYRDDYERKYVADLLKVAREINPRYDALVLREKVTRLPSDEQEALRRFFGSAEWTDVFLATLAHRGGTGLVPTDPGKKAVILKKIEYFKAAYEALGLSVFCDGSRPNLKRKNDYNDMHQLLYVNSFIGDVLVTEDGGIAARTGQAGSKVMAFTAFLDAEAT